MPVDPDPLIVLVNNAITLPGTGGTTYRVVQALKDSGLLKDTYREDGVLDCIERVFHETNGLGDAKTISEQGSAFNELSNAVSDLVSWHPRYDWEHGVMLDEDGQLPVEE